MTADEMKKQAAWAALEYITTSGVVGVGTGSTVNHLSMRWPPSKAA